jgi:alkaline phosphatase D
MAMMMRSLVRLLLLCVFSAPALAVELAPDAALTRIAFGSCAKESKPQPIWDAVLAADPQAFVFLGDNIYADTRDIGVIERKYAQLAAIEGFARVRRKLPLFATWDDHDFGENDAGAEYPLKEASRQAFLRFWAEPAGSPRWQRDGVYTSHVFGPPGQRVQLILLDLRYNRSPIKVDPRWGTYAEYERWARKSQRKDEPMPGPYARNPDPAADMLGTAQWQWLEAQLREPAELRLVASSLQVLADFPGWEGWINYPRNQARLFELIRDTGANGVVFLSGDTHYGELTRLDVNVPYPLVDITSSGLTEEWQVPVPNALRVGTAFNRANFGLVDIDWAQGTVGLSLRDVEGKLLLEHSLRLDALRAR